VQTCFDKYTGANNLTVTSGTFVLSGGGATMEFGANVPSTQASDAYTASVVGTCTKT
jgi:hypothetical protein